MTKKEKTMIEMTEEVRDRIIAMTKKAAKNASRSLQKLSDNQVSVNISDIHVKNLDYVFPDLGAETMVVGICLRITGDIAGVSLLIFPENVAYDMCDLLFRRESGATSHLTDLDKSALKEVGNILCGSFLTVLSNTLKIKIIENLPDLSFDMFGAVAGGTVAQMSQQAKNALVINVTFKFEHSVVAGHVLLVFGIEEMNAIIKAIEKVVEK